MPKPCSGDPRKAVGYIRVRTDTEKQSLGAEAQRRAIERWAEGSGVTILDWFVEEVSGGAPLDKRPVLLEAIATVACIGAASLVVQRLDRFSRDPLTAALAEAELQRQGATLAVADGAGNGEDATAALIRSILYAVSRFEKEMIRARIKAAFAVKRARGERVGAAPYGMKTDGKALAIHPQEAATVDRLRELRSSGLTLRAVVDQATAAEGLLGRAGKPLSLAAVHKLVKSAA